MSLNLIWSPLENPHLEKHGISETLGQIIFAHAIQDGTFVDAGSEYPDRYVKAETTFGRTHYRLIYRMEDKHTAFAITAYQIPKRTI